MIFSSISFLFYFLPIFMFLYFISPQKHKNIVLLLFSLIFYVWGEPKYILLMLFSCIVDYIHAIVIENNRGNIKSKIALCSSIFINLGMLFYFKYTDFFISTINNLLGTNIPYLELLLPIGISFYTFQTMSYSIDVYRGEVKAQRNFISLATYVTLFPQLIAGPIVRYSDIEKNINGRTTTFDNLYNGLTRFFIGLGKKVLLANNLGLIWEFVKNSDYNEIALLTAWIGIISFALQIYFDFSGYSDMAIGLGEILGFKFLENFNYPYTSKSISEFWRRWHMSLGQWFRDYVYIPLGGNRCDTKKWLRNISIVWVLTGLWHGAGINFVLWGCLFGIILVIEKTLLLDKLKKTPSIINHFYVLIIIAISWVLFEIESFTGITSYLKALFTNLNIVDDTTIYLIAPNFTLLLISILSATPIFSKLFKNDLFKSIIAICGLTLSIAYLIDNSFNPFLYFRF